LDKFGDATDSIIVRNVPDLMARFTLHVLGRSIFNYDFGALANKSTSLRADYDAVVPQTMTVFNNAFPFWWKNAPTAYCKNLRMKIAHFREELDKVIEEVKQKVTADDYNGNPSLLEAMIKQDSEIKMSNDELRDNCFIFFLAGHETTAGALDTLLYALGKYPEVQQKCFEEVYSIVGSSDDSKIKYEDVAKMYYVLMTIRENMRLLRSSDGVARTATIDTTLGDFKIPKGTRVEFGFIGIHNDPKVWGDPENFRPERFSEEESAKRGKTNFMSFGWGPHLCIGNNFSLLEQRLFVAKLLLRYEVHLAPGSEVLRFDPTSLLHNVVPEHAMMLKKRKYTK